MKSDTFSQRYGGGQYPWRETEAFIKQMEAMRRIVEADRPKSGRLVPVLTPPEPQWIEADFRPLTEDEEQVAWGESIGWFTRQGQWMRSAIGRDDFEVMQDKAHNLDADLRAGIPLDRLIIPFEQVKRQVSFSDMLRGIGRDEDEEHEYQWRRNV